MRDGHATTADDLADATAAAVAAVDAVTAVEDLRAVLDLDRVDGVAPPDPRLLERVATRVAAWRAQASTAPLWARVPGAAWRPVVAGAASAAQAWLARGAPAPGGADATRGLQTYCALLALDGAPVAQLAAGAPWRCACRALETQRAEALWPAVAACVAAPRWASTQDALEADVIQRLGACAVARLPASADTLAGLARAPRGAAAAAAALPRLLAPGATKGDAAATTAALDALSASLAPRDLRGLAERLLSGLASGKGLDAKARARVAHACAAAARAAGAGERAAFVECLRRAAAGAAPARRGAFCDVAAAVLAGGDLSEGDAAALGDLLAARVTDASAAARARALDAVATLRDARALDALVRRATRDASAACRAKAVRAAGKTALATDGAGEAAAAAAARACGDASPQVRAEAAKTLGALAAARTAPPEAWPAAALPLALRANDGAAAAAAVADRLAELVLEPLLAAGGGDDYARAARRACVATAGARAALRAALELARRRGGGAFAGTCAAAAVRAAEGAARGDASSARVLEALLAVAPDALGGGAGASTAVAACVGLAESAADGAARTAALRAAAAAAAGGGGDAGVLARVDAIAATAPDAATAAAAVAVLGAARGAGAWARAYAAAPPRAAAPLAAAAAAAAAGLFGADATAAAERLAAAAAETLDDDGAPRAARRAAAAALGGAARASEPVARTAAVPRLAAALERDGDAAVRATALAALADLATVRTALVDAKAGALAGALLDPAAAVRRAAVVALARLVGRDYLKLRPELCHRLACCAADADGAVAAAAAHALKEVVDDNQGRVARHVVGLVVALNGGDAALAARYGDAERRGPVYAAALAALSPERRGEATARLAKDVLGPAADAPDAALAKMDGRLADALRILRADLRLRKGARAKDRADDDADDPAAAALDKARGRLLGRASKKHLLEQVLPTLLALRHRLRALRLGVAADVEATLAEALRAHGAAVDAVLANDPMLARELRYDLKRARTAQAC